MSNLVEEIKHKLIENYKFKATGKYLIQGKCPSCNQKQLFTNIEKPFYLVCNRRNECRYEANIKEVYPELFEDWSKRFPPTKQNPNASAENYLRLDRGLELAPIAGAFSQEIYKDYETGASSATVRFTLDCGAAWEKIIDKAYRFGRPSNFKGDYGGYWWKMPKQTIDGLASATEIWICEGIFDAIALNQAGKNAVSAMSCKNYPKAELNKILKYLADNEISARPKLVFAYDLGKAGEKSIIDHVLLAREEGWTAIPALPTNFAGAEPDWNDLLKSERLTEEHFKDYLWNGAVLCAKDASEKAGLLLEKSAARSFPFAFKNHTYWARVDNKKFEELTKDGLSEAAATRRSLVVSEIANCAFKFLYFQRDHIIDETNYFLRITSQRGEEIPATFSGSAIAGSGKFKERLLSVCGGAQFTGNTEQLERIVRAETRFIKTITTIDFLGYSPDHKAYLLGDFAIRDGRIIRINKDKYFDFGKEQLKLRSETNMLDINYEDGIKFDWLDDFYNAFREPGLICLAFFGMALFAEQIRKKQQSLFFLEITGEGGSGKSTLLEFLWKLFGRGEYEGMNPNKGSFAGVARNMAKASNLPVVFIEADNKQDNGHQKRFDFDILKDAYNGRPVYTRGVKNAGTDTFEPPFRGALVIAQNHAVEASQPLLERICATSINKEPWWSRETKLSADKIGNWEMSEISGAIVHFIKSEAKYLEVFFEKMGGWETRFLNESSVRVSNQRIRKNHGQLHAGIDALFGAKSGILPVKQYWVDECHNLIDKMAMNRDQGFMRDPQDLLDFWEQVEWLEGFHRDLDFSLQIQPDKLPINLHKDRENCFALNISHYEALCRVNHQQPKNMDVIKKLLKTSKTRKFLENKPYRCVDDKVRNCWIFAMPGRSGK